jgi:hypothetical protein
MTTRILRATPVAGMVALKPQTVYQQFLNALDAFVEAKIRNAVPERELRRTQREDQSLSPADARRPQLTDGKTLIALARFQQRNERSDKRTTLMPSDVETLSMEGGNIEHTLNLSASRAYDSALDILGAYKLTGNFHINLEIILKNIDALDKVTFEIEPRSLLPYSPDRRQVLFRPNQNIGINEFSEIMSSIKERIGFDATCPWWARAFHWLLAQRESASMIRVLSGRMGSSGCPCGALRKPSTIRVRGGTP